MLIPVDPGTRRLMAADALLAAGLAVYLVFRTPGAPPWTWAVIAALAAPLAVRRRWPAQVMVVVGSAGAGAVVAGVAGDGVALAVGYAIYPVGLYCSTRPAALASGASIAALLVAGLAVVAVPGLPVIAAPVGSESVATTPVSALVVATTIIGGSWVLARVVRARRRQAGQLTELRAQRAVADERLRIARDVHDVVGHHLSLIAMKAAVANHLVDTHPEEGRAALSTIERVSRDALGDIRAVLGTLREPSSAPTPTDLDRLIHDVRAAGVPVDADMDDLADVPAAVRASAYRIVQEALTNVLRHAGPASCTLSITAESGILTISVVDEGTARHPTGPPGQGLLGMRERVALHGGTLAAGPRPHGGFAVRARLPLTTAGDNGG